MTENRETAWVVWKVPKKTIKEDGYSQHGVYPSGELMGVCPTEKDADKLIRYLEEFSPSERFGEFEDTRLNNMDDAPYIFTKSNREMTEF